MNYFSLSLEAANLSTIKITRGWCCKMLAGKFLLGGFFRALFIAKDLFLPVAIRIIFLACMIFFIPIVRACDGTLPLDELFFIVLFESLTFLVVLLILEPG